MERFEDFYDDAPCGFHVLDAESRVVDMNATELGWLGYRRAEVEGRRMSEFFAPESVTVFEGSRPRLASDGCVRLEVDVVRKDGSTLPALVSEAAVRDDAGQVVMSRSVVVDVSEHPEVEQARRERQELFDLAFDRAPVAMGLATLGGDLVEVNTAYCHLLGCTRDELLGMRALDLVPPDDVADLLADMARMRAGEEVELERRLRRADGELVWVVLSATRLEDAQGRPRWLLGHCLDITKRKRAEAELARANTELARANLELARSNAELEQFAYVASHDLQEPLRMVASFTQLLAQRYGDRLDDDAREFIAYAVDGATRMQHLLKDLLQYSRTQRHEPVRQTVDCAELVRTVLHDLGPTAADAGAEVEVGDLPAVSADPTLLRLVFQNLLANAVKFRFPGRPPRIRLRAERQDAAWRFDVADNGIGIPPAHRERIFRMFQRLHARDNYAGTGIGLAIVTQAVERHGGRVWVSDTKGGGATFSFTLPDVDGEEEYG